MYALLSLFLLIDFCICEKQIKDNISRYQVVIPQILYTVSIDNTHKYQSGNENTITTVNFELSYLYSIDKTFIHIYTK